MKKRYIPMALSVVIMAAVLFCPAAVHAVSGDEITTPNEMAFFWPVPEPTPAPASAPVKTPTPAPTPTHSPEPNPFTPAGVGTVIDSAADVDGKEFYTIMTPAENVFYLVIDRQREQQNVYFLNAVTEADLIALAEIPETPAPASVVTAVSPTPPVPTPEPTTAPEPEPEQEKSGMGTVILIIAVALIGGGAAWYFKIYRPKQQGAAPDDDYSEYEGEATDSTAWPGDGDEPPDGDTPEVDGLDGDAPPWEDTPPEDDEYDPTDADAQPDDESPDADEPPVDDIQDYDTPPDDDTPPDEDENEAGDSTE